MKTKAEYCIPLDEIFKAEDGELFEFQSGLTLCTVPGGYVLLSGEHQGRFVECDEDLCPLLLEDLNVQFKRVHLPLVDNCKNVPLND